MSSEAVPAESSANPAVVTKAETTSATAPISVTEWLTLAAILAVSTVSLVTLLLAHVGLAKASLIWPLSVVVAVVFFAVGRRVGWPRLRWDLVGLLPAIIAVVLSRFFFWPGFGFSSGDRDPGVYVEHAVEIVRTGHLQFDWIIAKTLPSNLISSVDPWPGMWLAPENPAQIRPQFYHLWPSLLSAAYGVAGFAGLSATSVLCAAIAIVAGVCLGRRFAGWPGAWVMATLMPTAMLNVWQSKYPTTESFSQMLYLGAALAFLLTVRTGSRPCAWLAGTFATAGFIARPDGIITWLAAIGLLALALATRRWDQRSTWAAVGVAWLSPFALWQAYAYAKVYTLANGMPSLTLVLAAITSILLIAGLLSLWPAGVATVLHWFSGDRSRRLLGTVLLLVCGVLFVIGIKRPELWGTQYFDYNGRYIRSFDEFNWIRLTWFFTTWALLLALLGVGFVGWRRWRYDRWMITLMTLGYTLLYCYKAKNSAYMMWSTRRFVPAVVPGLYLLIGCGVAALALGLVSYLTTRLAERGVTLGPIVSTVVSVAIVAGLVAAPLWSNVNQSIALRGHRENHNGWQIASDVGSVSDDPNALFLWTYEPCCQPLNFFGGPMMIFDQRLSFQLLGDSPPSVTEEVRRYAKESSRPLFIVQNKKFPPPPRAHLVKEILGRMQHWQETPYERPYKETGIVFDIVIYRVDG